MADLAREQVERLVALIAWMSQGDRGEPVSYAAAGRRLGVPASVVERDLKVLLGLTDGSALWDVRELLRGAGGFRWGRLTGK